MVRYGERRSSATTRRRWVFSFRQRPPGLQEINFLYPLASMISKSWGLSGRRNKKQASELYRLDDDRCLDVVEKMESDLCRNTDPVHPARINLKIGANNIDENKEKYVRMAVFNIRVLMWFYQGNRFCLLSNVTCWFFFFALWCVFLWYR
jgi:hypothetical protein